jgi:hypothetical protein
LSYLTSQQGVLVLLQHALAHPQLQFSDIQVFRQHLSAGFQSYSTVDNALYLGAQSATPGMAFLAGYQNAIRCLDADCPNDELAAFCVSEKGVKKPWDMATHILIDDGNYCLNGQKAYVMLLPNALDRMYVVAKNSDDQLRCLYLSVNSSGVSATDRLSAPFVKDIPHRGVRFDNVLIPADQLFGIDGHEQANKPFRYWEDVHVALSMMGWMSRELLESGQSFSDLAAMMQLINDLTNSFSEHPGYYSLDSIAWLDKSHEMIDYHAQYLSDTVRKLWLKDSLLLQMGQKMRHLVKAKIVNEHLKQTQQ